MVIDALFIGTLGPRGDINVLGQRYPPQPWRLHSPPPWHTQALLHPPRQKHLHVLNWDQLEVLAGYIPIVSSSGYATRYPLYLIGVDYTLPQPAEICVACGNLGVYVGDPSAKSLWKYPSRCVELETFFNFNKSGSAFFIGMSLIAYIGLSIFLWLTSAKPWIWDDWIQTVVLGVVCIVMSIVFYFLSGTHRSRGAFIRIHRGTRKLYYIFPGKKHLHILDWDRLEILAGYVPIVTGSVNTSRHPLYLIGVDHSLAKPAEVCVACGNLGLFDGDRSAKSLWEYLQRFMDYGPQGLPEPPPIPPRMSRKQATLRRFHEWNNALHNSLSTTRGKLWAPIMLPLRVLWLVWDVFPECLAEFIQYHVPYTIFPKEIDDLCGFTEKRKPVIRINGKIVDE